MVNRSLNILFVSSPILVTRSKGYCGRSAAAMWVWNHPLRLRKPLKRVGEKGAGQFEEVTWDEALNDIAARLKDIVQEKRSKQCSFYLPQLLRLSSKWLTFLSVLQIISDINLPATLEASQAAIWFSAKVLTGLEKMEPDYANLRYLILIGRSMGASMGALHTLNQAKSKRC